MLSRAAGSPREDRLERVVAARDDAGAEVVDQQQVPCAARAPHSSVSDASSVNPTVRKLDACTRISAAVSGPIARS